MSGESGLPEENLSKTHAPKMQKLEAALFYYIITDKETLTDPIQYHIRGPPTQK